MEFFIKGCSILLAQHGFASGRTFWFLGIRDTQSLTKIILPKE